MTWRLQIYSDRKAHTFLKINDMTTEPDSINTVCPHSPRGEEREIITVKYQPQIRMEEKD